MSDEYLFLIYNLVLVRVFANNVARFDTLCDIKQPKISFIVYTLNCCVILDNHKFCDLFESPLD